MSVENSPSPDSVVDRIFPLEVGDEIDTGGATMFQIICGNDIIDRALKYNSVHGELFDPISRLYVQTVSDEDHLVYIVEIEGVPISRIVEQDL